MRTCPSIDLRSHALSSARPRTFFMKSCRRVAWPSSRFRRRGFGFAGREANLEGGPGGDEKQALWGMEFSSSGARGADARMGEEERGEGW